jgi:hypothetical protein
MAATEFTRLELFCAGAAFVDGLCKALMPKREAYEFPAAAGYGHGEYDTAQYCQEQCIRLDREDKAAFFAECLAKFDASMARIAQGDDISRYSIAAE